MMTTRHLGPAVLVLMVGGHAALAYGVARPDLHPTAGATQAWAGVGLYLGLLALWGVAVARRDVPTAWWWAAAVLARVVVVFAMPQLSDDVHRFVWDGQLSASGLDPYAQTPEALWVTWGDEARAALRPTYDALNSRGFFTVYPPLMQMLYAFAAACAPGSVYGQVVVLKSTLVAFDLATIAMLVALCRRRALPAITPWLYALHPLPILEVAGNAHAEGIAVFGILASLWALSQGRAAFAGAALSIAVSAKLLPVLLVPPPLRRLSSSQSVRYLLAGAVGVGLPFVLWLTPDGAAHMAESLRLYTTHFEWNGPLFRPLKWLTGDARTGPLLATLSGIAILTLWWRDRATVPLARTWLAVLGAYLLFATTVHPWYLLPLAALAVLTPYRSPLLWASLAPLTYVAYGPAGIHESWAVFALEYGMVLPYAAYEIWIREDAGDLERLVRRVPALRRAFVATLPARVRIKRDRLLPHLSPDGPILDLGAGHGGVCQALRDAGHDVLPVDVEDRSYLPDVQPVIYDGVTLPFPDDHVHTVLLATVLHHCPDPDAVLAEAKRVASHRVVVMEDIYTSPTQRALTLFTDSVVNLEFKDHPHTNRDDAGWRDTFARLGLHLQHAESAPTLGLFRQAIYVLSTADTPASSEDATPAPGAPA